MKQIPPNTTDKEFDMFFKKWGTVISSMIKRDANNVSLGYGYVQFKAITDAERCLESVNYNQVLLNDSAIKIERYDSTIKKNPTKNNLYLKDFGDELKENLMDTETQLQIENDWVKRIQEAFSHYGEIHSIMVKHNKALRRPYAFICFKLAEDARKAYEGTVNDRKNILKLDSDQYLAFQKTPEELQKQHSEESRKRFVYIKFLKSDVTEQQIRNAF